jgi:RES domain-containing protein
VTFTGVVWCHIPAGGHPLHLTRLLRAEGRWNDAQAFGALYFALDEAGALAEYRKALQEGTASGNHELASVEVRRVQPVARLLPGEADMPELRVPLLTGDGDEALEYCRSLARRARREGFGGLLVPSAARAGSLNLVLYPDVIPPPHLDLVDGPHRRPIGDWGV